MVSPPTSNRITSRCHGRWNRNSTIILACGHLLFTFVDPFFSKPYPHLRGGGPAFWANDLWTQCFELVWVCISFPYPAFQSREAVFHSVSTEIPVGWQRVVPCPLGSTTCRTPHPEKRPQRRSCRVCGSENQSLEEWITSRAKTVSPLITFGTNPFTIQKLIFVVPEWKSHVAVRSTGPISLPAKTLH